MLLSWQPAYTVPSAARAGALDTWPPVAKRQRSLPSGLMAEIASPPV